MSRIKISVAMATYNGERFLQEQLDSLAAQTHLPCELVVGDDGSTDGTLGILERFAETAPFPVRIWRNPVNLGFGGNFLLTASRCVGEWIAFCDQDDVWLPEKLSTCVHVLRRHPQVSMFVHEVTACDEQLRQPVTRLAGFWISRIVPPLGGGFRNFLGCSIVFRRNLLDVVASAKEAEFLSIGTTMGHDVMMNLLAYCIAFRYQCRKPLILYRRHANAVTADYSQSRREKLGRVRSTTSEFFLSQQETSGLVAKWFRDLATHSREPNRESLMTVAGLYERRSRLYGRRGELYSASEIGKRLQIFSKLVMDEAYLRELTIREQMKDLLRTLASGNLAEHDCARLIRRDCKSTVGIESDGN